MTAALVGLATLFVAGTVVATLGIYALTRRIFGHRGNEDTRDLAGSVTFRISALHGLILALVFAQELADYGSLRGDLVDEATAIANIWNDAARHGPDAAALIQPELSAYLRTVARAEWDSLGLQDRLSAEGWIRREAVYQAVLDLPATTPRQDALRRHMLDDIQRIAELRQARETSAAHQISPLFWVAAFGGVALVAVPYFVFAPSALNLTLFSLYGAYTGLVMFMIFAFSDPFAPPGRLSPEAFEVLLQTEIGDG